MQHVFISYVRENRDAIDRLADDLLRLGIKSWVDRKQLAPGTFWEDAIRQAITDGGFFLACFSEAYVHRDMTYMNEELDWAIRELRQHGSERPWFIPVYLDPCTVPALDFGNGRSLSSFQEVRLHEDWAGEVLAIRRAVYPQDSPRQELRPPPTAPAKVPVPRLDGKGPLVAFDFGTSFSCAAIPGEDGRPVFIPDGEGRELIPSIVTFEPGMDYAVGRAAENLAVRYPERTIPNIKRYLGLKDGPVVGGHAWPPELIASLIIRSLKQNAEAFLGQPVHRALVSVPANFKVRQTHALAKAFELAGLEIERLIGEPNAAALLLQGSPEAAKLLDMDSPDNGRLLVLDLGGGTFDVSVMEGGNCGTGSWVLETLAILGDNALGGIDFDDRLQHYALARLLEEHKLSEQDVNQDLLQKLRQEAIRAKFALGSSERVTLLLAEVERPGHGFTSITLELTQDEFRSQARDLTDRVHLLIERCLERAQTRPEELSCILLAGQGMKVFTLEELLTRMFPDTPRITSFQEHAVVRGLSYHVGLLDGLARNALLLDQNYLPIFLKCAKVYPEPTGKRKDLKISVVNQHNTKFCNVFPSCRTIPTLLAFTAIVAGSGTVTLSLFEGSDFEDEPPTLMGSLELPGLLHQDTLELHFSADASRTIELRVTIPRLKKSFRFRLNNQFQTYRDKPAADAQAGGTIPPLKMLTLTEAP
jgi:molecular chaperone DnaK (HSP70)